MAEKPVLICFDGSEGARTAVKRAGELLAGRDAVVLTVWTHAPLQAGLRNRVAAYEEAARVLDEASAKWAQETVEEGTALATQAGLKARALAKDSLGETAGAISAVIREVAEAEDAGMIVVGSRGLAPPKSWVLGSVSHHVTQHGPRPVLVVHG